MKKKLSFGCIAVLSFLAFFSCSNEVGEKQFFFAGNQIQYGSIVINGSNGTSRSVDYDELTSAEVSVLCPDGFVVKAAGTVNLSGGAGKATVNNIPVGKNRVVKVESNVSGAVMYALIDEIVEGTNEVSVNWDTTALGAVFYNLIQNGTSVIGFGETEKTAILQKIPKVHGTLVDAAGIAADYPNLTGSYVLDYGTVELNVSGADGFSVQVTDIASKKVAVSEKKYSENLIAFPGTWKVKVSNGTESAVEAIKVFAGETSKIDITYGKKVSDKIVVRSHEKSGFTHVYTWGGDSKSAAWPGDPMTKNGDYYEYTLGCTSTKIILNSGSDANKTKDLSISEAGIWEFNGSGFDKSSGEGLKITVTNPTVPEKANIVLPSGEISIGSKLSVQVSSNCEIAEAKIQVDGTEKDLVNGTNSFKIDEFVSAPGRYDILVFVTNKAGTETKSGSIVVLDKPLIKMPTEWNELSIYQVMVASFQDGDPNCGYSQMWGPDNQLKGGDLQGIINAIPYIKELGCNAIWMTPIFNSDGDGKLDATGYFAYDYFNIDPKFGTMETFDELVEKCHENGIAVILDGVFGHNKGRVAQSPNRPGIKNPGISPSTSNPVNYADNENSLKYYSDVARYWITEHKIDGWRFDQCYQLGFGENAKKDNCDGCDRNHWYDIRRVIEEASASNGTVGQNWGTLGYIVGEHWRGDASLIQKGSVDGGSAPGYGLNGCFDFPAYYQLVQGFAQEWGGKTTGNIGDALSYTYKTYSEKGYACREDDGSYEMFYPNLMLTNHDLFRIGDLINKKHNDGFDSENYAKRNMVLLAAQGAYTGPITIYYGDEIGDHNATTTSGWGSDNVARSSGKVSGFNSREQKIHDFEQKVLIARSQHEALWNGANETVVSESDFYVSKKTTHEETIYVAFNYSTTSSKVFAASGYDLLSSENYSGTVSVPPLSAVYVLASSEN